MNFKREKDRALIEPFLFFALKTLAFMKKGECNCIMTKKKIKKMIADLKVNQDFCRREIQWHIDNAKSYGYIVYTYEDIVCVYHPDYRPVNTVQTSLDRNRGIIYGLQLAIDALENEL